MTSFSNGSIVANTHYSVTCTMKQTIYHKLSAKYH